MNQLLQFLPLLLIVGAILFFLFPWAAYRLAKGFRPKPKKQNEATFLLGTVNEVVRGIRESESDLRDLYSRAERKASFLERYHHSILESMSTGVMACNRRGEITVINNAAAAVFRLRSDEARGRRLNELLDPNHYFTRVLQSIVKGKPIEERVELKIRREGESVRWVELRTSVMHGKGGQPVGAIFVFNDVTERKTLRNRMELKERLAAMGEVSAGITHEFRNSLHALSGLAKLIGRRARGDGRIEPLAGEILKETGHMERTLNDLKNYLKPQEMNWELLDPGELVRSVLMPFLEERSGGTVRIKLDMKPDLPRIRGDRALLSQALRNLARNAWQAMAEGGTLTVTGIPAGSGTGIESQVVLIVSDTGAGIPEDVRVKVFTPFFTTRPDGTGLGLPFVHKVIAAHGGSMDVDSVVGEGTTFTLFLPAIAAKPVTAAT